MIIRKSRRELERMAVAGSIVARALDMLRREAKAERHDQRPARPASRRSSSAPRPASHLQGLSRLHRVDLLVAEQHDRAWDPRAVRAEGRRRHLDRRRGHAPRLGRGLRDHRRGRRRRERGAAPARDLPPVALRRDRHVPSRCAPLGSQARGATRVGQGFGVVRSLVGHRRSPDARGSTRNPNYGQPGRGPVLAAGMVLAIEPMITAGDHEINPMPTLAGRSTPPTARSRRMSTPSQLTRASR